MRFRRAFVATLILGLSVASLSPATHSAVAATTPASTSERIGLFAPDWGGATRTDVAWETAARNHTVLVGNAGAYGRRIDKLHAVNPALTVLVYTPGPYLFRGSDAYKTTLSKHPDYFARDALGNLITVPDFPANTLMDVGHPGWRQMQATMAANVADRWGFDGVYVDSMGHGPQLGYTNAKPINEATGRAYTAVEWLGQSVLTLNAIKAKFGQKYVLFNGLRRAVEYGPLTHILANSNADGGMAELFLRHPGFSLTAYPPATAWKTNLEMFRDVAARGMDLFVWTKTWVDGTTAEKLAWCRYALATYLLAKGSDNFFYFHPERSVDRTSVFCPEMKAGLGRALGPYTITGSVYTRLFQGGVVSVNPVTHQAVISLK